MKRSGVEVHMHWIKAHVGHVYNERADKLANAATNRPMVDVEVKTTRRQGKRHLFGRALSQWQNRWDTTGNGEVTYELFPWVCTRRLHGNFYLNQVLSEHSTFGDHQTHFFQKDPTCFCGTGIRDKRHWSLFLSFLAVHPEKVLPSGLADSNATRFVSRRLQLERSEGHCR